MVRLATKFAGLAMLAVLASAPNAHASTHFAVSVGIGVPAAVPVAPVAVPAPVPAPAVVAPVPAPAPYGYVWVASYYAWNGYAYTVVPGAWVRPPYAGAVWVAPRYVSGPHGAYYARGYWHHH